MHKPTKAKLWDFAVAVYGGAGVPQACIALQDEHGLDVNILLFAAWAGVEHRLALTRKEIELVDRSVCSWRTDIVRPLREIRRQLKTGPWPAPSEPAEALRQRIKAIEIVAEQTQLNAMEGLLSSLPRAGTVSEARPTLGNLIATFVHFAGVNPDNGALDRLTSVQEAASLVAASSV